MVITPSLKSTQFSELKPGDLFFLHRTPGSHAALAVHDPKTNAKDKMLILPGPRSSTAPKVPTLMGASQQTRVVSFAKDYKLRLPCDPSAWLFTEPPAECACLVLAEDKLYIRARLDLGGSLIQCYIGVEDGVLLGKGSERFAQPSGDCTYTLDWAFLTTEEDARRVLFSPHLDEVEHGDSTTDI